MSLPRYPEYKESGLPWIGAVPRDWNVSPLLGVARERRDSNYGMKEDNLLSLSYGRIVQKDMTSNDGLLPESFETYQIVRPGDIVFRLTDLQNDKRSLRTASVEETGIITSAYLAVEPTVVESKFLSYLLRAYDLSKVFYSMGGGLRQSMKYADVKRLPVLVPSMLEQQTIATFLDCETAKIDALIAEQEKLLALLAEKRQATISHAVTRGLDPNAPMKDSGIPWLGEVPAHWEVLCLKNVVVLQRGHDLPADARQDGDVPVVSSGGYIGFHSEARASGPGIVTGRYGSIGSFVYVEDDYWPLNTALYSVALHGNDARYVWYMLQSVAEHFVLNSMKSAVPGVDRNDLHTVSVVRAPNAEQKAIVSELDALLESLDGLSRQCKSGIQLLKERRSALIAAAVTGQIDVRGAVESQAA